MLRLGRSTERDTTVVTRTKVGVGLLADYAVGSELFPDWAVTPERFSDCAAVCEDSRFRTGVRPTRSNRLLRTPSPRGGGTIDRRNRRSSSGRAARGERVGGLDIETDSDHSGDGTTFSLLDADRYSSVFDEVTAGSPQKRARRPIAEETARIERNALGVADDAVDSDTRPPVASPKPGPGRSKATTGLYRDRHVQSRIVGSTPVTGASTPLREAATPSRSPTDDRWGNDPFSSFPPIRGVTVRRRGRCGDVVGVPTRPVGLVGTTRGVSSGTELTGTSIPTTNSLRSAN